MSGVPAAIQSSFAPESFTSFAYFVGTMFGVALLVLQASWSAARV
jgi:hypothetical protein